MIRSKFRKDISIFLVYHIQLPNIYGIIVEPVVELVIISIGSKKQGIN